MDHRLPTIKYKLLLHFELSSKSLSESLRARCKGTAFISYLPKLLRAFPLGCRWLFRHTRAPEDQQSRGCMQGHGPHTSSPNRTLCSKVYLTNLPKHAAEYPYSLIPWGQSACGNSAASWDFGLISPPPTPTPSKPCKLIAGPPIFDFALH